MGTAQIVKSNSAEIKPDTFYISDDALIRSIHVRDNLYREDVVITKEMFIECYKRWVATNPEIFFASLSNCVTREDN